MPSHGQQRSVRLLIPVMWTFWGELLWFAPKLPFLNPYEAQHFYLCLLRREIITSSLLSEPCRFNEASALLNAQSGLTSEVIFTYHPGTSWWFSSRLTPDDSEGCGTEAAFAPPGCSVASHLVNPLCKSEFSGCRWPFWSGCHGNGGLMEEDKVGESYKKKAVFKTLPCLPQSCVCFHGSSSNNH